MRSYSAENLLTHASVKKGHFRKTLSQEYSKLAGLRFTKRKTPLKIFFWNFFEIFQTSLRNLVWSSFLITLEPVDCKPAPPDKMEIIEYSRRGTFPTISKCTFPGKFSSISKHFSPENWSLAKNIRKKRKVLLKFEIRISCPFWAILEKYL